ncbi:transmembrane protein [Auriculariales sp. MPI-PUGE-AT-0066]|nr:transmembrane protein [Auriculariales sp. MPI-PUGE-AT-0066]
MAQATNLYLDPQIRDWVLFPITIVMILVGVLRHYVTQLLGSTPQKATRAQIREQRAVARSQVLRQSATKSPIPPAHYRSISSYLQDGFAAGTFLKDGPPSDKENAGPKNPLEALSDPSAMDSMMDGMKKQAVMMVPQMVIMGWINFFFQGFVLIKLPFPLTTGFKSMLQRGVDAQDMDVRWVSSLSWYILNLFGLNGVYRLLLGGENAADSAQSMAQSPFGMGNPGAAPSPLGQDMNKIFKGEKDNLELADGLYVWACDGVEDRILAKYGRLSATNEVHKKSR